jgi:hypothetical protein
MKRQIEIEWKHIGNDVAGTCDRCSLTGDAIREVLENLASFLDEAGVTVRFRETVLPDSRIEESNQVLINGTPLEEYLAGSTVVQTPCCSCACITGQDEVECRAIEVGSDRYEAIPAGVLKQVIVDLVGEMVCEDEACSCDCGCGTRRGRECP